MRLPQPMPRRSRGLPGALSCWCFAWLACRIPDFHARYRVELSNIRSLAAYFRVLFCSCNHLPIVVSLLCRQPILVLAAPFVVQVVVGHNSPPLGNPSTRSRNLASLIRPWHKSRSALRLVQMPVHLLAGLLQSRFTPLTRV